MTYALLCDVTPFCQILTVDGPVAAQKGVVTEHALAVRIVDLLNRHGLEDVVLPEGMEL